MTSLYFLSYSAPADITLLLLTCLARVHHLAACSREPPARSSRESLLLCTILNISLHSLTHYPTLPLHESHLNTGLLIAKIQANLTRNKVNKMVD